MEEKVYTVAWTKRRGSWLLRVRGRPDWQAESKVREDAEETLTELIQNAGRATRPVFQYDPPLGSIGRALKRNEPELFLISFNMRFDSRGPDLTKTPASQDPVEYRLWRESFYDSPFCKYCGSQPGPRSSRALQISAGLTNADGGFGFPGRHGGFRSAVFSKELLVALTPIERNSLSFREVERVGKFRRSRRRFF